MLFGQTVHILFLSWHSDRPKMLHDSILTNDCLVCGSKYSSVWLDISPTSIQVWIWLNTTRSAEASILWSERVAALSNQLLMAYAFNEFTKQWNLRIQSRCNPHTLLTKCVTSNSFKMPSLVRVLHVTCQGHVTRTHWVIPVWWTPLEDNPNITQHL
jgi:hypothetical protein